MRTVCCIYRSQQIHFIKRRPGNKCTRSQKGVKRHYHLQHAEVVWLVKEGVAEWIGEGERLAMGTDNAPVEWHKVKGLAGKGNARLAAMQMLRGGEMRFPRMVVGGLVSPR